MSCYSAKFTGSRRVFSSWLRFAKLGTTHIWLQSNQSHSIVSGIARSYLCLPYIYLAYSIACWSSDSETNDWIKGIYCSTDICFAFPTHVTLLIGICLYSVGAEPATKTISLSSYDKFTTFWHSVHLSTPSGMHVIPCKI